MKLPLGERIRAIRDFYGLTTKALAETIGVKEYKIKDIERGKQRTPGDVLESIVEHYHVNCYWLLTGKGRLDIPDISTLEEDQKPTKEEVLDSANMCARAHILENTNTSFRPSRHLELESDFILVPRYDVQASAGHGVLIHSEQIVDHLAFKRDWVRGELRINPDSLALIHAVGDSMEPAIQNNDLLLIDLSSNSVTDDAIYVLSVDGSLLVKRIQKLLNGGVIIKSDNNLYEPQTLKKEELSDLRILGRVVWFGRAV